MPHTKSFWSLLKSFFFYKTYHKKHAISIHVPYTRFIKTVFSLGLEMPLFLNQNIFAISDVEKNYGV